MRKTEKLLKPTGAGAIAMRRDTHDGGSSLRAVALVAVACLMTCLLLHTDISAFTTDAYASTWPTGSSREGVCLAFGEAYTFDAGEYTHRGVDISAKSGSAVKAPVAGHVSFVGNVPAGDAGANAASSPTMRAVSIEIDDGRTITLMPFEDVAVAKGQAVGEGATVGTLASSGDRSWSQPHLHMGLKEGRAYLDPLTLFGIASSQTGGAVANAVISPKASKALEAVPQAMPIAEEPAAAPETLPDEAGNAVETTVEPEPSYGRISSGQLGDASVAMPQVSGSHEGLGILAPMLSACKSQLDGLLSGYGELADKFCVPIQLLVFASVALTVSLVAIVVFFIISSIRRNATCGKESEKSSLFSRREDASIYGLFPAPGTSFITRGRLAQRR